ncbi:hypothetical protein ACFZDP_05020 [Streptomyces mirabilis]|uniref:hypothetical protein n=1 Tax=Streptomyces mirabilis TaxID=68239 RepID=UPI0036E861DA
MLRPGGHAVITTRPWRDRGELVDLPSAVLAAAEAAALIPVERCVALLAGIRDGQLVARPSFFQMKNIRDARRQGASGRGHRARGHADPPPPSDARGFTRSQERGTTARTSRPCMPRAGDAGGLPLPHLPSRRPAWRQLN